MFVSINRLKVGIFLIEKVVVLWTSPWGWIFSVGGNSWLIGYPFVEWLLNSVGLFEGWRFVFGIDSCRRKIVIFIYLRWVLFVCYVLLAHFIQILVRRPWFPTFICRWQRFVDWRKRLIAWRQLHFILRVTLISKYLFYWLDNNFILG